MNIWKMLRKKEPLTPAGLHHFRGDDFLNGKRVHLRVEADGRGILMVDASRILHLNQTAVDFLYFHLSGWPDEKLLKAVRKQYRVGAGRAAQDWAAIKNAIRSILMDEEVCPITFLGLDRIEPFQTPVAAPYRMDLALTYRCNVDCAHCYNERKESAELTTDQWKTALKRIWDAGIPHVAFTGGEPTLREDLPELIALTQSLGLVAGLLTNGVRLADRPYLHTLVEAGLDYAQITLESAQAETHNAMVKAETFDQTVAGLRNCLAEGLYTITNTTITRRNAATLEETVRFLAGLGLKTFALNSIIASGRAKDGDFALTDNELTALLPKIRSLAEQLGLRLIWYTPTRYCRLDPMALELGPKRCTAGQYNMCVEPDGSVIPCQSYYQQVGNILTESWETIWNNPVLIKLRNREWVEERCRQCEQLPLCGGGCPLESEGKDVCCPDAMSNG